MKPAVHLQPRPLSPHLQIYRRQMTMVMSILHRITGAALYSGTLLLAWGLVATAWSESAYAAFETFVGSPLGRIVLLGYTWTLAHHLLGGLRHFIWDTGRGLERTGANAMAWGTLIGSILLTAMAWGSSYLISGSL